MKVVSASISTPDGLRTAPAHSRLGWASPLLIAVVVVLIYAQACSYPFQFDDVGSILANASLQDFSSGRWLVPPSAAGETVGGRPLLNLSFALNHALGGLAVEGYRGVNILIHVLAALTLYGVARRVAALRAGDPGEESSAAVDRRDRLFSAGLALLWACHPLQTGAVTYVVQRAESLAGLFYLLTLYSFLRGAGDRVIAPVRTSRTRRWRWYSLASLACLAGVATKETVVTAPVLVLLLDRALLSGSFAAAWRARWPLYGALAASWPLLGLLVAGNAARGGSAGFTAAIDVPTYLLTQCRALPHYLSLAVWPRGLVFDHGVATVRTVVEVLPQVLFLAVLGASALGLLIRNHIVGTMLAGFFLLLAPSSSFVPIATQTIAEHRMYLPLAAVLGAGFVLGGMALLPGATSGRRTWVPMLVIGLLAVALGTATLARNGTYRSGLILWQDTVARCPANARARHNLGLELMRAGRTDEAAAEFRAAIALQPNHAFARAWLGHALLAQDQPLEAERHLRVALAADPAYGFGWVQLGNALCQLERDEAAAQAFAQAVRLDAGDADAHFGLAVVLAQQRRIAAAMEEFQCVIELDPARIEARSNLGNCLLVSGRVREAITAYEEVLRLQPGEPTALRNLALAREYLGE